MILPGENQRAVLIVVGNEDNGRSNNSNNMSPEAT
jgi:hypothetical protein